MRYINNNKILQNFKNFNFFTRFIYFCSEIK